MPAKPMRGSMRTLPVLSSTPTLSLRADPSVLAQESPGPVRPMGLRHFRRFADRAAANRRLGEYRIWRANSCRPTRIGGCTDWRWIS